MTYSLADTLFYIVFIVHLYSYLSYHLSPSYLCLYFWVVVRPTTFLKLPLLFQRIWFQTQRRVSSTTANSRSFFYESTLRLLIYGMSFFRRRVRELHGVSHRRWQARDPRHGHREPATTKWKLVGGMRGSVCANNRVRAYTKWLLKQCWQYKMSCRLTHSVMWFRQIWRVKYTSMFYNAPVNQKGNYG